jgi:hypothetical protein
MRPARYSNLFSEWEHPALFLQRSCRISEKGCDTYEHILNSAHALATQTMNFVRRIPLLLGVTAR